jgi:hypothetical protein
VKYRELIKEYQLQRYSMGNNKDLLVYKNPSPQNLEKLLHSKGNLRGLVVGNDVVWAKSYDTNHYELVKLYGISLKDHTALRLYFFNEDGIPRFDWDVNSDFLIKNHPQTSKYLAYGKSNWKIYERQLKEGNRLYSAITLKEIPEKYKKLPMIGRGTTSIILEKSPNTVLMLTRDGMKKDWLTNGLGIADWIDSFESRHTKFWRLNNKPIYVLEMPKLFPLSKENKHKVKKLINWWKKIRYSTKYKYSYSKIQTFIEALDDLDLDMTSREAVKQLMEFLANYDEKQYSWDLGFRNMMQTATGELVILDPVVDSEIIDIYYDR